jgi:hypothetical protein
MCFSALYLILCDLTTQILFGEAPRYAVFSSVMSLFLS